MHELFLGDIEDPPIKVCIRRQCAPGNRKTPSSDTHESSDANHGICRVAGTGFENDVGNLA